MTRYTLIGLFILAWGGLPVAQAHGPAVSEIPLPAGMSDQADADGAGDPRGLPRLLDYDIRSISRHTLADTLRDERGRAADVPLGRVETREYRLNRYAKRPPASPAEILTHYHRQLAVIGGVVFSQTGDRLTGRYLRGDLPVEVALKVTRRDGSRYELTIGGPGAQDGVTGVIVSPPPPRRGEHPPGQPAPGEYRDGSGPQPVPGGPEPQVVDPRPAASSQFKMPPDATFWPPRGTRGMAVLLAGPGVDKASAVRFGTSDAEILARKTARVRVRVPQLATGWMPVTVIYAHGSEKVASGFQILDAPLSDSAAVTVPPCDGRPGGIADVGNLSSQPARPGQILKLTGRRLHEASHVTFTVAREEVDPVPRGINPELVGIDFGAEGKGRTAPRWLDTLAANFGRSDGAQPTVPGACEPASLSGYAAIKHTGDREGEVCVPTLAMSGPIGLWRPSGASGDTCDTSEQSLFIAADRHHRRPWGR